MGEVFYNINSLYGFVGICGTKSLIILMTLYMAAQRAFMELPIPYG